MKRTVVPPTGRMRTTSVRVLARATWIASTVAGAVAGQTSIPDARPDATTWATCGTEHAFFAAIDANGDGFDDVITVGVDRKLYVSPNVAGWKAAGWRTVRDEPLPEGLIDFATVRLAAGGASAGSNADGRSAARVLALTAAAAHLLAGEKLEVRESVAPPTGMAFRGILQCDPPLLETADGRAWILEAQALREAAPASRPSPPEVAPPNAPPYQPDAPLAKRFAGDLNGDGLPDPIGVYRMSKYGEYQELRVLIAPRPGGDDADADGLTDARERALGANPLDRDSDDDGLLDGWEVNGLPRGVELGARIRTFAADAPEGERDRQLDPRRADVICCLSYFEGVDPKQFEQEMPRVQALYRQLANSNPDGSRGVWVHFVELPGFVSKEDQAMAWWDVGNKYQPARNRGLMHWMQITPWGGGQSSQTGDMGGCGNGWQVFAHEFGHQLGLGHEGDSSPAWCPLYPSLMSYAFSYSLGGDGNAVRFSDGRFRATVLHGSQLTEHLPYAYDELKYLEAHPFRYRLAADPAGGTFIDWNHNGQFDAQPVVADINYGGSTDCGVRRPHELSGAGPALAYVGPECWLLTLSHDQGALRLQRYLGHEQWSEKLAIPGSGTVDDPLLAGTPTHGYAFFRRRLGWYVARFAPEPATTAPASAPQSAPAGGPIARIEPPALLEGLPQGELSVGVVGGRLLLICRRDDDSLTASWLDYADKPALSAGQVLEVRSVVPVGFGQDPVDGRVVLVTTAARNSTGAIQCMRVTYLKTAGDRLIEQETVWTRGETSGNGCVSRPVVAFDDAGQLNIFHTGGQEGDGSMIAYRTRRIGNQALDEGWLTCMLYDVWTRTRRPIAFAHGPQGAIYAFRWDADGWTPNNTILVGFNGFGIQAEPMRDFDDGEKIGRYGLVHSILWMQPD